MENDNLPVNEDIENNDDLQLEPTDISHEPAFLQMTGSAQKNMLAAARWAKFFSLTGYIAVSIFFVTLIIGVIFFSGDSSPIPSAVPVIAIFLPLVVLYFIPSLLLTKFSRAAHKAAKDVDEEALSKSQKHLKNTFLFFGIITILTILTVLGLFYAVIVGMSFLGI